MGGMKAWVIQATPKPGYKPANKRSEFLKKIEARLWIAQQDHGWIKVEADTTEKASFGWFLVKLNEGARLELKQRKVNGEVWMLESFMMRFNAKLGLVKTLYREVAREYSNFRKFQTDSRMLASTPLD